MAKRHMYDGTWYLLSPPEEIGGKKFTTVWCVCQVPDHPDKYQVRGTPENGDGEESFIFTFTNGDERATPTTPPIAKSHA